MKAMTIWISLSTLLVAIGCKNEPSKSGASGQDGQPPESFSLAWSEYPSWSVFGVADELGLLDGDQGELGSIETKYGIDIELKMAGYNSCLTMYASQNCDAVCITNMDALINTPGRPGVAVLPTSTSNGADACLVTDKIPDFEALKKHKVYGLKGTVSEYCFVRGLEKAGFQETDFQFTDQDPGTAALNMQNSAETHQATMVWNPYVLQTLRDRPDVRVLFDSTQIPGEIVDMVVIGSDSLGKKDADKFVKAVIETFYEVGKAMKDEKTGDEVLLALGKKFSNLGLEDMKTATRQTDFYETPEEAIALFSGDSFKATMRTVQEFCKSHSLVAPGPSAVGYGSESGEFKLRFDPQYLR